MKKLYQFHWNCGRMGDLDGIFIAEDSEINALIGKEIYFGEVLGKHSEIHGTLEENEVIVKSEDPDFIEKFISIMGDGTISGFNPLDYYDPE
ncbi:hypothetical protein [Roseibium album]|uniref:hypothetical protein n=1 Tax=Roseibium album TaxID=311410 RepID=UPI003BB1752C